VTEEQVWQIVEELRQLTHAQYVANLIAFNHTLVTAFVTGTVKPDGAARESQAEINAMIVRELGLNND
jgi:hypothetical protein